jgi:hypothetical protein
MTGDGDGNTGSDESDRNLVIGPAGTSLDRSYPIFLAKEAVDVLFTFPEIGGSEGYNVYEGDLGIFNTTVSNFCHRDAGDPNLRDNGDGTLSYTLAPGAGDRWFLVTSSNCVFESPDEHSLAGTLCGTTP